MSEGLAVSSEPAVAVEDQWSRVEPELVELFADFKSFCSLLEIRLKELSSSTGRKTFHYEDWHDEQKAFEAERTGLDITLKPRQIGFTTLELARDLWYALVHPGVSVLVIIHDKRLAEQLWGTLSIFAECLDELGLLPQRKYSTKKEIVFENTRSEVSIIEAGSTADAAKKKGRSQVVHRLHATEVAFWQMAQETMGAVLQSVPTGGEVCIESTPNGAGGLFYQDVKAALEGRSEYKLHFFPWWRHKNYRKGIDDDFDQAPRDAHEQRLRDLGCDDEQLAWWRAKVDDPKIGLEVALAEYPSDVHTCFRTSGHAWFDATVLDRLAEHAADPIDTMELIHSSGLSFPDLLVYEPPDQGLHYVVFADPSEGRWRDGSSATVLETRSGRTVATWWSDHTPPGDFGALLDALGRKYNFALVGVERNNNGFATLERLAGLAYPRVYAHDDGRPGWPANTATRPVLWEEMARSIREKVVWSPDAATIAECRTIILDADGKPRARGKGKNSADSCRDDRFVSWAGAWQMRMIDLAFEDSDNEIASARIQRDYR